MSAPEDVTMANHKDLRADIHAIIQQYPSLTVYATLGVLEIVKADLIEMLESHP